MATKKPKTSHILTITTEVEYTLKDLNCQRSSNLMVINVPQNDRPNGQLLRYKTWRHEGILEMMREGYALMCEINGGLIID